MVVSVSGFRPAFARYRGLRLLWMAALFGVIFGGVPRWQMHQHALAYHQHEHEHGHHHGSSLPDVDDTRPVKAGADAEGAHGHATPSIAVVLIEPEFNALDVLAPRTPDFPASDLRAPAGCWPPPYRPPIA